MVPSSFEPRIPLRFHISLFYILDFLTFPTTKHIYDTFKNREIRKNLLINRILQIVTRRLKMFPRGPKPGESLGKSR